MKTEKNILIAFILNLLFSIIELIGGIFTNSIAIISDAIHDFGDSISIGISYFLEKKSNKKPDNKYTYGYKRYSILGALITNSILIIGSIIIIINALNRIINPTIINYNGMIIIALFGVVINTLAAYFTKGGTSLNQKAVNLHMLEDVLGWIIVLVGSIIIKFTEINVIDSLLSIGVAIFILVNALKSFKVIIDLFLEKTPQNIDVEELKEHLLKINGVIDIHHIHIRSIDGFNNYLTMHVVVSTDYKKIKKQLKEELSLYGIGHSTIEFEEENEKCDFEECEIKKINHSHHHHHNHNH